MKYLFCTVLIIGSLAACSPSSEKPMEMSLADTVYVHDTVYVPLPTGETVTDQKPTDFVRLADVVPDIIQEIRYYTTYNFVGRRIPGYEAPVAWMTRQAADSLLAVSNELLTMGYRLKVFDAYRPQRAVNCFAQWAHVAGDTLMKPYFYPNVPKSQLFLQGYIAHRSGHTRGSTIDLTLFDMRTEREVDMGGTYDLLDPRSHPSYRDGLTDEQIAHRQLLRHVMMRHGYKPISSEWWHFHLANEPYPDTSFDFVIR